jgi:hypothetical protein
MLGWSANGWTAELLGAWSSIPLHLRSALPTPSPRTWVLGLGAQAQEGRLREVFEQAGYSSFHRAAETPLILILEARHWSSRPDVAAGRANFPNPNAQE